jgi:biotin-dependent carboxylase-like uncharacterized protein
MSSDICQVLGTGLDLTIQDDGRPGWRRFGVPASGTMDPHAAAWANRLVNNLASAPVVEILAGGASLRFVKQCWIALTGAGACVSLPNWHASHVTAGTQLDFKQPRSGTWSYLAVEGGFDAAVSLGSASSYSRGQLGSVVNSGDILRVRTHHDLRLPTGVSGRLAPWTEQRNYRNPPPLRVWPAPQWDQFPPTQRDAFFDQPWSVTPQSNRVGYRLSGEPLRHNIGKLISEPVLPGTIQIPENGLPIVTMPDGPTVGGYPKLGIVDAADISWLAQAQPGQQIRFTPTPEL